MQATQTVRQTTAAPSRAETRLASLLTGALANKPSIPFEIGFPSGARTAFGQGPAPAAFSLEIANDSGIAALQSLDELRVAEAYMDGDLDIRGDLQKAVALRTVLNDQSFRMTLWRKLQPLLMGKQKAQEEWVHNHYDSANIQLHFLDTAYNTYTPGLFASEDETLEAASERKHRTAFEGLGLRVGQRVLDIGSGWGSFLRYAARRGVDVTGVTLSRDQLAFVQREIIDREQLPARLHYGNFFDFAPPAERFDAVAMLGVIEELADYPAALARVARLVKPGGKVYLDFMAATEDFVFPAFISKYIYQGGTSRVYLPKFVEAATRSPFEITAIYNDRRNYYLTALHWYRNFEKNADRIRSEFGEKVYRMFRLYLVGMPEMLDHETHLTTAYRVFLELPADALVGTAQHAR